MMEIEVKQEFCEQHFVPELLGRREICLPLVGAKTNELIAKCHYIREGLFYDRSV